MPREVRKAKKKVIKFLFTNKWTNLSETWHAKAWAPYFWQRLNQKTKNTVISQKNSFLMKFGIQWILHIGHCMDTKPKVKKRPMESKIYF